MLLPNRKPKAGSDILDGVVETGHHGLSIAEEHHGFVHVEEVVVNASVSY